MSRRAKWSIGAILLTVVAVIAVLGAARRGNRAVEVRIEPVEIRDLVASVTASGQVQPRTKVDVAADISGRIVRLAVREGQIVSKGQFLLEIDASEYQAAVQRAEAALAGARAQAVQAKANLTQSRNNFSRSSEIKRANPSLVSDEQIEQLRTQVEINEALYEAAQHGVDQAQASLRDARSRLAKTVISAPMGGRVTRLNVEQGETAVPGTFNKDAALLLTIADMGVLETKIRVDETDVARISVGDSAEVEIDAFPDTTFVGRVVQISNSSVRRASQAPVSADQAVDYEVTVELSNAPSETRPDFSATAKIITDQRRGVLSVPIIALTVREHETLANRDTAQGLGGPRPARQVGKRDTEGVFVVRQDGRVTFRPVKVGIAGEQYFEVLAGLEKGERIVAGTYQAIRDLKDSTLVRASPTDQKGAAPANGGTS